MATGKPSAPSKARSVKTLLAIIALILACVAAYFYSTSAIRLDREIQASDEGVNLSELPQEVREIVQQGRNEELLKRHVLFGAFTASGLLMLLMAATAKRRFRTVMVTALFLHMLATGAALYVTKDQAGAASAEDMRDKKLPARLLITFGFCGLLPAIVLAFRIPVKSDET